MQEIMVEKKKSKFGKLLKVLAVGAAVYGAFVAVGRYMSKKDREMDQNNAGSTLKNYLTFMNGRNIRITNEAVEQISIQAYMGGVDLNLTEANITKDVDIAIKCAMSGIHITVPPMVRVILDGTNVMSGFANMVPNYESEDLPTIFICADSIMGGIAVEMAKDTIEKE